MCANFTFKNAKLSGVAITVGENKIDIDSELNYYNNDREQLDKLKKSIGFESRYIANSSTTTFDLCLDATKRLLAEMNLASTDIDAIISVTQTPDYYMPGNAHLMHKELNCSSQTLAFDLEFGCSGFIMGLFNAFMMINSGMKRVLLLTGDTLSKIIDVRNRADAPIFGDSGSASIIEYTADENETFFVLHSDGKGADIMYKPAGAYRMPSSDETRKEFVDKNGNLRTQENFYMEGFDTFSFTLTTQPKLLKDILAFSEKTAEEIDYFILHQANVYIVETIIKKMKIDLEKAPTATFKNFGNQSSASIPGTICYDLTDKFVNSSKKVIMQGFGIGLSWGACQTTLKNTTVLKPVVFCKGE